MTWRARFGALPAGQRVAVVATAVVAAGAGVLSWDGNTWAAGEIGIDPAIRPVYGVVVDGAIAVGTAAVFVLQGIALAAAWGVLLCAVSVSLFGNGAHARPGSYLHTVGSMVPVLLLAACLFVLELIARAPARTKRAARAPRARGAHARRRAQPVVLPDGRTVSAAHARKLRARQRAQGVPSAA